MKQKGLLIFALLLLIVSCATGRTAKTAEYYLLDYPPPVSDETTRLDHILKVEKFSIVQLFNSNTMARRKESFALDLFPSVRWKANPAALVTDSLVRDFRYSGSFRAVFSYGDTEMTRFNLEGSVAEFAEIEDKEGPKTSLILNISLLDRDRREGPSRIIFQKNYSHAAICTEKGPRGLARGLSESMERLSRQIISDVYRAVAAAEKSR